MRLGSIKYTVFLTLVLISYNLLDITSTEVLSVVEFIALMVLVASVAKSLIGIIKTIINLIKHKKVWSLYGICSFINIGLCLIVLK